MPGGAIGSISFAIITDLFPFELRGRVMGFEQTSFAASQLLGTPFAHLRATVTTPRYVRAFAIVTLVSTGGFMLMPFSSAFCVHNLGMPLECCR